MATLSIQVQNSDRRRRRQKSCSTRTTRGAFVSLVILVSMSCCGSTTSAFSLGSNPGMSPWTQQSYRQQQQCNSILSARVNGDHATEQHQQQEEDEEEESTELASSTKPSTPPESSSSSAESSSSSPSSNIITTPPPPPATSSESGRKMNLMWCDRDKCKDVVRERVVGDHNQIILNGPATGQVAYRWSDDGESTPTTTSSSSTTSNENNKTSNTTAASILLLVKPDKDLFEQAAQIVPQLTQAGIQVLLVPDLAAKLKYTYGVEDTSPDQSHIKLFDETLAYGPGGSFRDRYVDDPEEMWVQDLLPTPEQPFPDLVCTLGGDGLLIYASMLFQGPVPPILSIAGGSLGFLTCFELEEMVEAVKISLGIHDDSSHHSQELDVFPPNMPSYPYEPLSIQRSRPSSTSETDTDPSTDSTFSLKNGIHNMNKATFGMDGVICMTIRMRLDCRIVNPEGIVKERYNVLNEVVIDRGSSPYLAALECFCDDVHLTTVQADGIIFATPTGSTAYSMAAGGSVVHPAVPSILVTPICPHVLSFRSMVFPDHVVLRCFVPDDARSEAGVAFDGKHRTSLRRGESVQIQMSSYPVPTINRGDHSSDWLQSLKRSFNFNTRPRQRPLQ